MIAYIIIHGNFEGASYILQVAGCKALLYTSVFLRFTNNLLTMENNFIKEIFEDENITDSKVTAKSAKMSHKITVYMVLLYSTTDLECLCI